MSWGHNILDRHTLVQANARARNNEALASLYQRADEFTARLLASIVWRGMRVGVAMRRCAAKLSGVAAFVTGCIFSPVAFAEATSCGELPCRANGVAYVSEAGGVVVQIGEEFSVELSIADGKVTDVTPRKLDPTLKNSIELKLTNSNGRTVMLSVKSHVGNHLKYDAYMKLRDGRLLYTSSCPLMGGLGVFETWSDPIESLELRNFRFLESTATMHCK